MNDFENINSDNSDSEQQPTLTIEELIDIFMSNESNNIMRFYEEIQNRYYYFFDKLHFYNFMDIIISLKFNLPFPNVNKNLITYHDFIIYYQDEINTTFWLFNRYNQYSRHQIDKNVWTDICYQFTSF